MIKFLDQNCTNRYASANAFGSGLQVKAKLGEESSMELGLRGKNAIITGGSQGIGLGIAQILADEGANVAICARTAGRVAEAVNALAAKGVRATGAAVDVTDTEALRQWVDSVAKELGGIDIVVANTSAFSISAALEEWRRGFEVDLLGNVALIQSAAPYLEKSPSGVVTVISSIAGVQHWPFEADWAYGSFKAALIHHAKALSRTWASKGIRVNSLCPGPVYSSDGPWGRAQQTHPGLYEAMIAETPFGRMGTPEEIGAAVAFLSSKHAGYISGINLVVDGNLSSRVQY